MTIILLLLKIFIHSLPMSLYLFPHEKYILWDFYVKLLGKKGYSLTEPDVHDRKM